MQLMLRTFQLLLIGLLCSNPANSAELSVMAASSLTESLREIVTLYQMENRAARIHLNIAGSQTLATQLGQGAPADLFISANHQAMQRMRSQQLVEQPERLLQNRLVIAVRSDLRPRPASIAELTRPGLLLAIGNPQVPVGRYTRQLLSNLASDPAYGPNLVAGIKTNIVSEENRVKAIIAKLLLGEIDAGIVYQSDLSGSPDHRLVAIDLPDKHNPHAIYPVARVRGAQPATDTFMAFLFSPAAQQVFNRHGFSCGAN